MNKKILRVGIYLRLSNEDRDKRNRKDDSESIKNQRNMLTQYINRHPEFALTDEYCDEDLSGAGTYRPEFERLIRDCESKKLDIVLCKSQSRFSRDMEIVEKYINNKFKEWNIRFIGLSDNADTTILGNKKSRQINGLVNEWYLEDVSNNIRSAFHTKMKQGEFISPFAPFGYEIDSNNNNKLTVDPVASEIVKNIYNLYLTGLGFTGIAKYLNSKKTPCPSLYKYQKGIKLNIISNRPREEIKWNINAIKTILTNEVYLGHLIQGKRTTVSYKNHKIKNKNKSEWIRVLNTHEAIIDKETFSKIQIAMKERTKAISTTGKIHIFSGKVFCLECKHYMRKKNSSKHEYLVCSNNRDGYDDCINKSSIRYDLLADLVLQTINKKIKIFYDEEKLNNIDSKKKDKRFNNKIKSLEKQRVDYEKKVIKTRNYLKSLYEDKVNGIITKEQFKDLITDYNKNEDDYSNEIKSINEEITYYKMKQKSLNNNKQIFSKYQKLENLNRVIIDEFIDKIYIGKLNKKANTRDIQIKWNF
ncbi:MAG: recombinase family protein [Bacilli bacterium]|nr:recombinase family protein [Bacilli bacterium]